MMVRSETRDELSVHRLKRPNKIRQVNQNKSPAHTNYFSGERERKREEIER